MNVVYKDKLIEMFLAVDWYHFEMLRQMVSRITVYSTVATKHEQYFFVWKMMATP